MNLLNFRGEGSILSELKNKNWVGKISYQLNEQFANFTLFDMKIYLTPVGLGNRSEIIRTVFSYFRLIKEQGISESWYQEIQKIAEQEFKNKEIQNPLSQVVELSGLMQNNAPLFQKMGSDSLLLEFNESLIKRFFKLLQH